MITYNQYPSLLFLSYDKDNAPEDLPFEVSSINVRNWLSKSKGYGEMFGIIASLNTIGNRPKHYWLNDNNFNLVEYNDGFRNINFRNFISDAEKHETQYGCICFKNGGQYVYLLAQSPLSNSLKGENGLYFATALFMNNIFIGFEEGIVNNGFSVMPTGHYANGMDIGGYLSFVSICLSFFKNGSVLAGKEINLTSEVVYTKK